MGKQKGGSKSRGHGWFMRISLFLLVLYVAKISYNQQAEDENVPTWG